MGALDIPTFRQLALEHNPELRETAAQVEQAYGRRVQAGLYPNPQFGYDEESIGTPGAPAGALRLQLSQTIVTAGKRSLDIDVAQRGLDVAGLAHLGRKFGLLMRVSRAYYMYAGLEATLQVNHEIVESLERAVELTRKQVEEAKSRPRTDLLRVEALLENARVSQANHQSERDAAWHLLAAEVGLPDLPRPTREPLSLPVQIPALDEDSVTSRVLTLHTDLQRAAAEVDRAQLQVQRARADAIPDVIVAGGYNRNYAEGERGAIISVQAPIPLWDRKQGAIREASARYSETLATQQATLNRLKQETATAFARYRSLNEQAQRLDGEVIRRQKESLDLLLKGYQAGAAQVTFADVIQAEQDLNSSRLTLAETRRNLWLAIADLEGLMQLEGGDDGTACRPRACIPES